MSNVTNHTALGVATVVVTKLSMYMYLAGTALESVTLFFLFAMMWQKNERIRVPYYVIYSVGLFVDLLMEITWLLAEFVYYQRNYTVTGASNTTYWYVMFFTGSWSTILVANRCSALALAALHRRIWTSEHITVMLVILIISPFLLDGYVFAVNSKCIIDSLNEDCRKERFIFFLYANLFNIVQSILAVGIGIAGYVNKPALSVRIDRQLLTHSLYSSITLIFYCSLQLAYVSLFAQRLHNVADLVFGFANVSYAIYHYSGIVALFFLSPTFTELFCRFYRITLIRRKLGCVKWKNVKIPPRSRSC